MSKQVNVFTWSTSDPLQLVSAPSDSVLAVASLLEYYCLYTHCSLCLNLGNYVTMVIIDQDTAVATLYQVP